MTKTKTKTNPNIRIRTGVKAGDGPGQSGPVLNHGVRVRTWMRVHPQAVAPS